MGVGVGRPQYTTMEQAGIFLLRPRGDLLGGGERTKRGGICYVFTVIVNLLERRLF